MQTRNQTVADERHELWDLLAPASDERIVLSVVADASPEGWRLLHGTVLTVPERCDELGWRAWEQEESERQPPYEEPRHTGSLLVTNKERWLLGRETLEPQAARDWLEAVLRSSSFSEGLRASDTPMTTPAMGGIPALEVDLTSPTALTRVLPGTDSPASKRR